MNDNHDLIERYLYAVTRRISRKNREDVAKELRGLIDDMLAERCGSLPPTEKDVRVVLTELGDPQELYEKYSGDSGKRLIGQPYYSAYLLVLKIVLFATGFGLLVSGLLTMLMDSLPWYALVGQLLAMEFQGLTSAFAIVTLMFVFFDHKRIPVLQPFNFDNLPPVPKKKTEIPLWEPIAGIVFSLLFLLLFLVFPQVFSVYLEPTGWIPFFHIETLQNHWLILVLFSVCGVGREVVCLLERRYNRKVLAVTLVSNILSALLAIWWLTRTFLLNPDFLTNIAVLFAEDNTQVLSALFQNFQYFFLGVMLFALILNTCACAWKTLKT